MQVLDRRPTIVRTPLPASLSAVARSTGKSVPAQLREIVDLYWGPGHLSPSEYFYFGLYDDRYSREQKRRFVGVELQNHILRTCTDKRWWAVAHDKLAFYAMMQAYGLPVPRTLATLHAFRTLPGATALRTLDDASAFLRHEATYPLFGKPFDGMRSVGSARIDAYDAATDELTIYPGRSVPVAEYVQGIAPYVGRGYLFQAVEHPHETVRTLCGDRLASVRLVLLVGKHGPKPFRAVWKFPTGPHVADNYWRSGNLLAGIDIATGRVTRVMTGTGTRRSYVDRHPDSGVSFDGLVVPDWPAIRELCLAAAATMPGITMQGWDVAPTVNGPVLIEANIGGDFTLPQLGNDTGVLDDDFVAYLESSGFRPRSLPTRLGKHALANVRWFVQASRARVHRIFA